VSVCVPFSLKYLTQFFKLAGKLVGCKNIDDLVNALSNSPNPEEWKCFTDLLKLNLKGVLLLNGKVSCQ
jgi:hypothetical protein